MRVRSPRTERRDSDRASVLVGSPRRARAASFRFFFQAEDGIRDVAVTGVQTCALPISARASLRPGIREMLRVLKPGRRLALAAWHVAESNPFFYAMSQVIDRYVAPTPSAQIGRASCRERV